MSKVLFEITEEQLETGMRGYPVGYCTTSSVDPQKGLFYRGKKVAEIADYTPEQMIHLLHTGGKGDLKDFSKKLRENCAISSEVIKHIEELPREGHPMKLFPAALLILGMFEESGDYEKDCMTLIAKLPHLVATLINHHAGWGKTPAPDPKKAYMEDFAAMLNVPDCDRKILHEVMALFNIMHYDHGGGNLSAFTGKTIASGLEDLFGSIAGSMCALAGPRHGKANQDCLEFVKQVEKTVGANASESDVEKLIRERLANKKLVFGFGHAVLRVEDPRATIFYEYCEKHFPDHPLVKIALHLRSAGPKVLAENEKISNPYPNVDAISGTMLTAAGFAYPEYFTVLFGLSRSVGIATQIVYERTEARSGKGTPITRPKYIYRG
ncbi:MAG: citrate (Si)-synthase [Simkaniaceae bacterium]|nr:citrate (Si)-synthase [Simkaniaceae bacterium]